MHKYTPPYLHTYIHTYVRKCVYACTHTFLCTYIPINKHKYTYIHILTHTYKLWRNNYKIVQSQWSNIKTVQQWATSSTSWQLFIFCLQQVYRQSVWIGVIKRGLERVKCIVLSGVLCFTVLQGAVQSVSYAIGCSVHPLDVWTQKGRKCLRHIRKRTRIWAEPLGTSSIYPQTQTWPSKSYPLITCRNKT